MGRCSISSSLLHIFLLPILINRAGAVYNPSRAPISGQTGSLPILFPRQAVCADDSSSVSCGVGNFCCPSDTRCIPVESNSSVVCCKIGELCDEIFPIPCTSSPLASKSVTCGTQCCPAGYVCGQGKDRCVMKVENLPADYVASRQNATDEALRDQCQRFLNLSVTDNGDYGVPKCSKFTFEGILIGFFPGVAVGFAMMLAYIKFVEMKTRRRTMHFSGRLSATPDDLSYIDQKPPPVPKIQENFITRYSLTRAGRAVPPTPATQGDWKARGPTDFSPNLGPTIAPRKHSASRYGSGSAISHSTNASTQQSTTAPLRPRPAQAPARTRVSAGSVTEPDFAAAVSQALRGGSHKHIDDNEGLFNEVLVMDGMGGRGRGRISGETEYTASLYLGGEGPGQLPFVMEEVPPLRYGGPPRLLTGGGSGTVGLGWDNNKF